MAVAVLEGMYVDFHCRALTARQGDTVTAWEAVIDRDGNLIGILNGSIHRNLQRTTSEMKAEVEEAAGLAIEDKLLTGTWRATPSKE